MIASSILPARYRSKRTNRVLALANRSLKKVERSLDVKKIIQSQDDLKILLKSLLDKQQMWLFKRQRTRLMSIKLKDDKPYDSSENELYLKEFLDIRLQSNPQDEVSKKLIKRFFTTKKQKKVEKYDEKTVQAVTSMNKLEVGMD
jgi:DNA polymerase III alpha subunit